MPKQVRTDPARIFPAPKLARDLPPFWELEQLLREGFDHDSALAELARRRESWSSGPGWRPRLPGAPDDPARGVAVMNPASPGPPPLLNIANLLTGLRLALVPVFLVLLMAEDGTDTAWRLAATGVFAVAALTDRFDGELARSRGLVTSFGTIADPIADKALIGSALIGLSVLGLVPWWVTVVIMGREIGITLLRFAVLRHGIIPASRGGKAKTLLQSVAIGLYVLPLEALLDADGPVEVLRWCVMGAALALTVITGVDYVLRAARLRATAAAALRDGT